MKFKANEAPDDISSQARSELIIPRYGSHDEGEVRVMSRTRNLMSTNNFSQNSQGHLANKELGRTMNPKLNKDLLSRPAWDFSKKFDMSSLETSSVKLKRELFPATASPTAISVGGRSTASFKSFLDRNKAYDNKRKFKMEIKRRESVGKLE